MELFKRRYLCFIAFLFMLVSFAFFKIGVLPKLITLGVLFVLVIIAVLLLAAGKRRRFAFLVVLLSVIAAFSAVLHSFLFVSIPTERAKEYKGEFSAELEIISLEYADESSAEYTVRLLNAKGKSPDLKAYLVCDFKADLSCKDRIIALVDSEEVDPKGYSIDKDVMLVLRADDTKPILHAPARDYQLFSLDGLKDTASELRAGFGEYVDSIFGDDSALVKGMLVNDKSDMSVYAKAQFSRSGAAHLLAVSGLHVSLLLGALELLLKKLLAPKGARIAILSLAGVILLALTDFSPSAVRSMLMLFAVYVNYLFAEESDAPTSLFVAVAVIILFSPFSVIDVGMWLSFAATLGLVSVYPLLEKKLPYIEKSKRFSKKLARLGVAALKAMLITLVANVFTLPIMWLCFGSVSLSSLPCNLILSPLTALFLPISVLALVFGKVVIIGDLFVLLSRGISTFILGTVSLFADARGATLSLEYPFAAPLIALFALAMAVMMVIKLKKKLFIALPPLALALSFSVCLGVFALTDKTEIKYVGWGENEMFFVERAGVSSVCDVSTGTASAYNLLISESCEYSLEIENYVLTHPHAQHPTMLRRLYENKVVRHLYLPLIDEPESLAILKEIYDIASEYHTEIIFYSSGEGIDLSPSTRLIPIFAKKGDEIGVALKIVGEEDILTYTDESESELAFEIAAESRYFLFGAHGSDLAITEPPIRLDGDQTVIFATTGVAESSRAYREDTPVYVMSEGIGRREFIILP